MFQFVNAITSYYTKDGKLTVNKVTTSGLNLPVNAELKIHFRKGGEIFNRHNHKHSVKKLLQEAQIPPWLRPFIPLIYLNNSLIMIPNVGIADGFQTAKNGWKVCYH